MKKILKKFPVTCYYVLSIIYTIMIGAPQTILFPDSLKTGLMLPQWGPALAAITVVFFLNGKVGIKNLFSGLAINKSRLKYSTLAFIIPVFFCSLSYVVLSFIEHGHWEAPIFIRSFPAYLICLIATLFSVTGEEIGWRGFMLPKLSEKYSLFTSTLIVGILWGIWHFRFESINLATLFVLSVIEFSFISSWLYTKTNRNLIASIIFHGSINMCSTVLFEKIILISNSNTSLHMNTLLYGIYAVLFALPSLYLIFFFFRKTRVNTL